MKNNSPHSNQTKKDGGWTYVETLIVIAIVIVLSGTVGFLGLRYVDRARTITASTEIENLSLALNSYYLDCKRYPSEDQGLLSLWEKPTIELVSDDWSGPYITNKDFTDPWGQEYVYMQPGPSGLPFGIKSLGADNMEGGEGSDRDISSWE